MSSSNRFVAFTYRPDRNYLTDEQQAQFASQIPELVWQGLVASGDADGEDIAGVLERSDHASWLNPVIYEDTYYTHALSVKPEFRGKRVGYALIENAINKAREQGFARFQLDVLSDNPAVGFYRAVGLELLAETTAPKPAAFGVPPEYRMGMKL